MSEPTNKKTRILITHHLDKTIHHFLVDRPDKLNSKEVERICEKMGVQSLFVNGKFYEGQNY